MIIQFKHRHFRQKSFIKANGKYFQDEFEAAELCLVTFLVWGAFIVVS